MFASPVVSMQLPPQQVRLPLQATPCGTQLSPSQQALATQQIVLQHGPPLAQRLPWLTQVPPSQQEVDNAQPLLSAQTQRPPRQVWPAGQPHVWLAPLPQS